MINNRHKTNNDGVYSETTQSIRISVLPEHLEDNSDPLNDVYAFAYTITIENLGEHTVQLLERHWIITSGGVQIAEVIGPGVVGAQPVLEPGQTFEYSSGAVIHDPVGAMHGNYTFRNHAGQYFDVTIPRFELAYPVYIH
ncbi:MAG: Co2+/Mg2+ efflux protein ApaG [Deltaproteobacteria bacterium]|nr:Co2+/Mg2+ efflux protein ApaG [Deltaproteobacteria bacterium]